MTGPCATLTQIQIDWLLSQGVTPTAIVNPSSIWSAIGTRHEDGRFDANPEGQIWLAFEEPMDWIFWQPRTGELATEEGRSFALGEDWIDSPSTCALDGWLSIFGDPLEWLRHDRRGIVVLDWRLAFDRLHWVTRIAVAETLFTTYRRMMKPPRMPKLAVLPKATERWAA